MTYQPASAQTQPPAGLLQQYQPGQVERRFQPLPEPLSQEKLILPEIMVPTEDTEAGKDTFLVLAGIDLKGNVLFTEADLRPLYAPLIGRRVSLSEVMAVVNAITVKYRDAGYILSQAFLPPQTVENGVISIQVVEGYIDDLVLELKPPRGTDLIRAYARDILSGPLRALDLERFILLVNDLPGMEAQVVIRPSTKNFGAANLVLVGSEDRFDGLFSADNRGSRFVGPVQYTGQVSVSSVFLPHDQVSVSHIRTADQRELRYYNFGYKKTVGTRGALMEASFAHSNIEPGFTLKDFEVESSSNVASVNITYPVIRSRAENLSFSGGLTFRNSESKILQELQSRDRLRVLEVSGSYDFLDSLRGINLLNISFVQGLDIMGASENGSDYLSRAGGRNDFTKTTANILRLQQLTNALSLYVGASGQYSFSQLLSSEEFGYGGTQYGRAYDPSEITGDHGVAGIAELRYGLAKPRNGLLLSNELYGFYDIGTVWHINSGGDIPVRESGASTGFGIRSKLAYGFSSSLELALPLTRPVEARSQNADYKGQDHRFFFSLSKDF